MAPTEFTTMLRRTAAVTAVLVGLVGGATARGEFAWHPDFNAARTAALESRRPVLAVFVDDLTAGNPLAGTSLDDPAADAVLNACFETVILDRATAPDLARKLVVSRVPMLYVFTFGAGARLVTAFPPPETTPEFVAAAARAAQEATALSQLARKSAQAAGLRIHVGGTEQEPQGSGTTVTDSKMSRKFRRLSEFAGDAPMAGDDEWLADEPQAPLTMETAVATTTPASPGAATEAVAVAAAPERQPQPAPDPLPESRREPLKPAVPINPESPWTAFLDSREAQSSQSSQASQASQASLDPVEPPAEQLVAMETPWLAGTEAAPGAFGAADAAPVPRAGALPPTDPTGTAGSAAAPPAKPAPSFQTQFVEALQKPFTFWRRPEATSAAAPATAPPAPPKLPAAWPLPFGRMPGIGEQAAKAKPEANPDAGGGTANSAWSARDPRGMQVRASYDATSPMPLGMEGYCPVTLVDKGAWVEGRAQWGARHRGRTYLFASEIEQRTFLAAPDRYAPAMSGDDPVLALDAGTSTPGQRRYGVTYQSRMYLFASPETRATFAADPDRYTGRVLMAEQAGGSSGRLY